MSRVGKKCAVSRAPWHKNTYVIHVTSVETRMSDNFTQVSVHGIDEGT